jgi:Outer membrane protein beta-barrel domain
MYSKHNLIALSLLVFATFSATAQVSLGLRGGIMQNQFDFSNDNLNVQNMKRSGLLGGAFVEFRINEGFALQLEGNYAQKGNTQTFIISLPNLYTETIETRTRINYLEIPILAKAGFKLGPARVDLLAGPNFSYALNGQDKVKTSRSFLNGEELVTETTNDYDFETDLEQYDLGGQAGLQLSFGTKKRRVFVDGRYLLGFVDQNNGLTNSDIQVKNQGVALTVGFQFGF